MRLLIDIGNTRTKYVIESSGILTKVMVVNNIELKPKWFEKHWSDIHSIVMASVAAAQQVLQLTQWAQKKKIPLQRVASEREKHGVVSGYERPQQLGVDRWLALLGGAKRYPNQNLLIIDAGTATTIDFLDQFHQHHGGWILPGIDALFSSIGINTAQVQAQQINQANITFGKNTSACVNNACWAATIGMIQQAIEQTRNTNSIDKVLLLGGNADALLPLLKEPAKVEKDLIFVGLCRYLPEINCGI